MTLKEKRQQAFLDYTKTIMTLENYFYENKDLLLNRISLAGDVNSDNISSFELILMSIYAMQTNYKKTYSFLIYFLEKSLEIHKKYKLNLTEHFIDIEKKIDEFKIRVNLMNNIVNISPSFTVSNLNLKNTIMIYNDYTNDVFEFIYTARSKIDIDKFNYRKYFKDDFYKNIQTINTLVDISRNSNSGLVIMRGTSLLNAFDDEDFDFEVEKHFPQ